MHSPVIMLTADRLPIHWDAALWLQTKAHRNENILLYQGVING